MKDEVTIKELTENVSGASTDFERTNTDLKRRYLIWNIEAFNIVGSAVSVNKGTFGTGYPFYALDDNLEGTLPVVGEQIRYNRQLVKDGKLSQQPIWLCKPCLETRYSTMPDLKKICKPCPNMEHTLKPRKIINRLPDIDMWLICEDGTLEEAEKQLAFLLEKYGMKPSDKDPLRTIEEVYEISRKIKAGKPPKEFLPIDAHIMEYSKMKELIEWVPEELNNAKKEGRKPYLPIQPSSYRKGWQSDDEAYNFIYDFLSAFKSFNFTEELQQSLDESRRRIVSEHAPEELFEFLTQSASEANARRFKTKELQEYFFKRVNGWKDEREVTSEQTWLNIDDAR